MDNWVSKVAHHPASHDSYISTAHRWDSRCLLLQRRRLVSKYVRTASLKMGRRDPKTMRPFGNPPSSLLPSFSQPLRCDRSVPLALVTISAHGQSLIDNTAILETREAEFKFDTTKPFKINADTNGVCRSFHIALS